MNHITIHHIKEDYSQSSVIQKSSQVLVPTSDGILLMLLKDKTVHIGSSFPPNMMYVQPKDIYCHSSVFDRIKNWSDDRQINLQISK